MATHSFAYDHAVYRVPVVHTGEIGATASAKSARFAAYASSMTIKSMVVTVVTAGGTANTIDLIRQATGGTALTTMCTIANVIGTAVGGVTTYALMTHASATAISQGDVLYATKGSADGVGVYAVAIEMLVNPGASITA